MTELVPLKSGLTPWPYDVERLIERWREGRSPQTLRAYTSDLQNFAAWMMATTAGSAIDALLRMGQGEANETVRAYRSSLVDKGIAPATINRRLSALRSLVALAKEFGYVTFDLSTKNVRSQSYRDTRGPERDIMVELLQYAKAQPHRAKAARDVAVFLLLGYGRALRRGEVVNLDLEHFDARGSRVSVLRKGKRERQSLSLDPLVTRKMKAWIALRGNEPGPLFLQVGRGGRVLYGRRLSGDGIHRILQTMGEKLGAVIRPHGLRHAAITAALDETNGNVRAAREFSGHASIEVLMRYDDNRKDLGGDVAGKVIRRFAKLFEDDDGRASGTMSNPRGNLSSISRTIKRLARYGDVAGIRNYVRGAAFLDAFNGLDPERRHSAMLAYVEAVAECEARTRLPLAPPIALNARTSAKLANWRNPAMLANLAAAYAQAQDDEGAARLLGVTVGAARLAKRRYLDRAATDTGAESP